ncbi:hypothetical protein HMPREF0378_0143 [Eubacterium nodatum ATCC 33099]|nr:hypothetical protein HMPREF0378_0143 [Eubacterium nodatum ATCC 33099]
MNIEIPISGQAAVSTEIRFYTPKDVARMTGWSEKTVLKMFNDPKFPSADFGRNKVIEADALRNYFSTRHEKSKDRYWRKQR